MSGRIEKSKSPTAASRRKLLRIIRFSNEGVEIMPCSNCRSRGVRCLVLPDSEVCGTCHRLGISCDASADAICTLSRLVTESDRLDREEEAEESRFRERAAELQRKAEAYQQAQAELNESLSKLERLRSQKRMVFKKSRIVSEEFPEDSENASSAAREAQANGAFGIVDWNAVMAGSSGFDFDFGTPREVVGSSGGS
ncbi:hypothetical protein CMEL01_16807 [Colletotrichum melonis]|uniref:Zn(2)-C6 fungal-type domain-containing protein n=1 Tax=Colletotrichum melonis TaxID=1209925 RepID=A0AAI9TYE9_9PEZI|nr:hypothetical protein CMEL01_16807 [Colletotrichum melonis]